MLIKNAKVIYTMENEILNNADILIKGDKIAEIGYNLVDDEVIDAQGLVVIPGIVDGHSHIGGFDRDDQDLNEMTNPITADVESRHAINLDHQLFKYACANGTTTSIIAPGSGNVIGGLVCAVKSAGKDRIIKNPVALKMALGGNPKNVYGPKNMAPSTRMSIANVIRGYLREVIDYMQKKEEAKNDVSKMPPYNQKLENGIGVIKREIPLKIHCTTSDMLMAIDIANEFKVRFTLDHGWGASYYFDEILHSNVEGVIFGPIGMPKFPGECGYMDIQSLKQLDEANIKCAIMTDGPILKAEALLMQAGEVTREGLPIDRVLRMLTINPAKICQLDDRIGSIKVGKDADLVIYQGTPALDMNAKVKYTIINGQLVYQG